MENNNLNEQLVKANHDKLEYNAPQLEIFRSADLIQFNNGLGSDLGAQAS